MKTKNNNLFLNTVLSLMLVSPMTLWGSAPQKYNSCGKKVQVKEPLLSGGYWFSEDCKTIYIEPAVFSKMQVGAFSSDLAVTDCQAIELFKKSYLQEAQNIEVLTSRAGIRPEVLKAKEKQIEKNNQKIATLNKDLNAIIPYESLYNAKKTEIEQKIENLKNQALTNDSRSLQREIKDLEADLSEINEKVIKVSSMKTMLTNQVTALEAENTKVSGEIETMLAGNPQLQERKDSLEKSLLTHIENYGSKKGGTAQVLFSNSQTELLMEFRRLNPGLQVERLPVQVALNFSVKSLGDMALPASVGNAAIPGVVAKFIGDDVQPGDGAIFFGNSLAGQVDLSMIATCEVIKGGNLNSTVLNQRAGALLIANATYQYHLQSGFGYNVTYNMKEVLKKISETKTKGGFFSSSTARKVTDSADFKDIVKVKVFSTDPLLNDQLEKMARDVRTEVLTRALNSVTKAYAYFDSKPGLNLGEAPQPAAPILASGVRKTCPHLYCQIGAFALDVTHALFGSTSQRDEYLRSVDQLISEDYEVQRMLPYYGTFTFKN